MKREAHEAYIDKLTKMQDSKGKELSKAMLGAFQKLLKASGGNPQRFQLLVQKMRKKILQEASVRMGVITREAVTLGRGFQKEKNG